MIGAFALRVEARRSFRKFPWTADIADGSDFDSCPRQVLLYFFLRCFFFFLLSVFVVSVRSTSLREQTVIDVKSFAFGRLLHSGPHVGVFGD